ncbi:MAG: hypothetical protein Q9222_001540 [Ikaeria aurantiellina]
MAEYSRFGPGFPRTSSERDDDRQPFGQGGAAAPDPYLAGYLDGLAAANANRNTSEAQLSLSSHDLDVVEQHFTPLDPLPSWNSDGLTTGSSDSFPTGAALSSNQVQDFPWPTTQTDLLPGIIGFSCSDQVHGFNGQSSTAHPPFLDDQIWCHDPLQARETQLPSRSPWNSTWTAFDRARPSALQPLGFDSLIAHTHGNEMNVNPSRDPNKVLVIPVTELGAVTPNETAFSMKTHASSLELDLDGLEPIPKASQGTKRQKLLHVSPSQPVVAGRVVDGAVQTVFRAFGSKRSKFDAQSRMRTALTRKLGACTACREKKLRVSAPSWCAKTPPQLLPAPCCRVELVDVKLFRLGSAATPFVLQEWTLSKEPSKGMLLLEDGTEMVEPPRHVTLTHDITTTSFAVTVSRFQPGPDDTTSYNWTDATGSKRKYHLPPYYISDVEEATKNLRQYLPRASEEFSKALLIGSNSIIQKTFKEAERYCKVAQSELVETALLFWSATRMLERFWLICGEDMLGLPPMEHNIGPCRRNPAVDAIVVTPIMDTQLDELAVSGVLIPLKSKLLRLLKKRILTKKKEYWYEIYLASFVILHNSERILSHVVDYARRFGMSPEPKSNDEASLSHAYYHACKTILAYFHFASGSAVPLSLDWLVRNEDTSIMTQQQITYLRDMQAEMSRQGQYENALH